MSSTARNTFCSSARNSSALIVPAPVATAPMNCCLHHRIKSEYSDLVCGYENANAGQNLVESPRNGLGVFGCGFSVVSVTFGVALWKADRFSVTSYELRVASYQLPVRASCVLRRVVCRREW